MIAKRCIGLVILLALTAWGPAWAASKTFRYGVYNNTPKVFIDAQGRVAGIFPDLLRRIADKHGWDLIPVECDWSQCLALLAAGEIDFLPDVAETPERREQFDFPEEPMLHSWSQVYVQPGIKLDSLLDLKAKRVAVLRGSVQSRYLHDLREGLGISFNLVEVESIDNGFALVAAGRADAVVANYHYGDYHAPTYQLKPTPVIMQPAALFVAASKRRHLQDELAVIDAQLRTWKRDDKSDYYAVLYQWSGGSAVSYRLSPWVMWLLGGTFGALLLALGLGGFLRWQVRRVTADLKNSRDELNTILDGVGAHVYIKDTERRYRYANKLMQQWLGRPLADIRGKKDEDFLDAQAVRKTADDDRWVLTRGERLVAEEFSSLRGADAVQVFLSVKIPLRDATGRIYGLCGIATDLTENKKIQDQLHALAYYDALTHLPNRRLLMDRVEQSLAVYRRHQRDGALIVLDLDAFSVLNNTFGHASGDLMLRQVAQRLVGVVRSEDTVARASSDEFVVLLHDLSEHRDEAARMTETVLRKIRQVLQESYPAGEHRLTVTASIGVAFFSDGGQDAEALFRLADLALHQAKAEGPDSLCFFNHAMQVHARNRAGLENDLRDALVRGEFFLEYQPQLTPAGDITGLEALVRWRHPHKGIVAPAQFIGVAESSALIIPLGRWILEQACLQLAEWADDAQARSWTVAVNVSARQFQKEDFVQEILDVLRITQADPRRLELELTESVLVADVSSVESKMSQLAAHGVKFALDDFGTGYSSLNYLKRLPLSKLKIDKSFIDELNTDRRCEAIVRTVVSLAQNLGLDVIAEGVESGAQVAALQAIGGVGCQGWYFAASLSPAEVMAWQAQRQPAAPGHATDTAAD